MGLKPMARRNDGTEAVEMTDWYAIVGRQRLPWLAALRIVHGQCTVFRRTPVHR